MNVVRKIYENLPAVILIPDHLKNRRVEVILLPLDEEESDKPQTSKTANPADKFIGAWQGEPLVRPEQGSYEEREALE
ncbi:MAG: hypothetical protein AB1656_08970 [Candidatus Omnitrophota bacterium]